MAHAVRLGAGTLSGALVFLLLTGCGGGGGGSTSPRVTKSPMPVSWTGETHSASTLNEPIELGISGKPGSLQALDGAATQAVAQAQPPSNAPVSWAIVSETAKGVASASPDGKVAAGAIPGLALLQGTAAPGETGATVIDVYPRLALSCGGEPDSAPAYLFIRGQAIVATIPSQADVWLIGPSCPAAFQSGTSGLYVAKSIQLINRSIPFAAVEAVPPPAGPTSYDILATFAPPSSTYGLEFVTADKNAVKFMITKLSCNGSPSCSQSEYVEGLFLGSAGGAWPY